MKQRNCMIIFWAVLLPFACFVAAICLVSGGLAGW